MQAISFEEELQKATVFMKRDSTHRFVLVYLLKSLSKSLQSIKQGDALERYVTTHRKLIETFETPKELLDFLNLNSSMESRFKSLIFPSVYDRLNKLLEEQERHDRRA